MTCYKKTKTPGETSNRPPSSKFHQQSLASWQPMLTPGSLFPYLIIAGLIMIGLGILFYFTSNSINEISIDYTDTCLNENEKPCSKYLNFSYISNSKYYLTCNCSISINLDQDMQAPIYVYYGLSNYYQNHRYYVRSIDTNQLTGQLGELNTYCSPYDKDGTKKYAPCGAIANSIFNDTFKFPTNLRTEGIAWTSDRDYKYKTVSDWSEFTSPPSWPNPAYSRSAQAYAGDEALMVWMRVAALPSFRKLLGVLDSGLSKATYTIPVTYNYPVSGFGGRKQLILTTTNWLGGRNLRMGIAYIVVGGVYFLLGLVFVGVFCMQRRQVGSRAFC